MARASRRHSSCRTRLKLGEKLAPATVLARALGPERTGKISGASFL
jgi:hypothetical protein